MPQKNVQLPDGRVVSFPDSMSDVDIAAAIKRSLPPSDPMHVAQAAIAKPGSRINPRTGLPMQEINPSGNPATEPAIQALPALGAAGATLAAGPEAGLAVRALTGGLGATVGSITKSGISGETPSASGVTADALLQGAAPEVLGAMGAKVGNYLVPKATQALSRVLGLKPASVMFGREPAEEVLRRGISGGSLKELVSNISDASKEVTGQLKDVLNATKATVDVEGLALQVSQKSPNPRIASSFLQVIDDASAKLGLKAGDLKNLSAADANALKQELAKQAKFVEGDIRPAVANMLKEYGGRIKDGIIGVAPEAESLLQSSANLTEASKGGAAALRSQKVGQSTSGIFSIQGKKIGISPSRAVTDTPLGTSTLFRIARTLQDHVGVSAALRVAFQLVYPHQESQE